MPAAYALWSSSASLNLQVRTAAPPGPPLPPGTSLITAQPAYADRPGAVSGLTCAPLLSHEQMMNNKFADVRFSWPAATGATSYVISIRNNTGTYSYDRSQTVTAPESVFRFERQLSKDNGDQQAGATPFYSRYAVRVLPMKNGVPGDPLYRTYQYEHRNGSNCHEGDSGTASPTGSIVPLTCTPLDWNSASTHSEQALSWPRATGATSYSVMIKSNTGSAGAESTVTGTTAAFRVTPKAEAGSPLLGDYTVRVQPMNGTAAGDPVYRTYRLGQNYHGCW
ncbi:MAG: hypothetical protein ABTA24_03060 [Arthrobacter sp.]